jgi:agmatinase
LRAREAIAIVREIAQSPLLIGADLSELSPPWDVQNMTAKLAVRLFLEIFVSVAGRESRSA